MAKAFADLAAQLALEIEFEFEKGLIAAVRSFRCLFAINHHYYHNTVHNKVAWQQISNCLKKPVFDCINRWYALVQTFLYYHQKSLCSKEPITWPHYEAFEELQPFMVTDYTHLIQTQRPPILFSKSTASQREALLNELIANRLKLLSSETPIEQVQKIWACMTEKLNNMGPRMPIIKWQRCWWEMKIKFGKQMWQIQKRQQSCAVSPSKELLSEEDMKIMKFCGANVLHSYSSSIAVVLDSYIELGSNREKPIPKCRKCRIFLTDFSYALCDACRKFPNRCDICLYTYEQELVLYQLTDWTLTAKSLLPPSYHTYSELSMCTNCSNSLQKDAAATWKVCRVCEKSHKALDNLFSSTNEHLREVFKSATNITFNESEGLPGYICNICRIQMHQFNNFYLRFCRSQCRLKEIHATKFIHIDSLGEEGKASNLEKPKTYLIKRDIAFVPPPAATTSSLNDSKNSPKGRYVLNPEITSGPVIATPPYNTLVQAVPFKGFKKVLLPNKAASNIISKAGPVLKRVYLTKPSTVPAATGSSTIPGVVPVKRMCIGPTNTKGVVSLQQVAYTSQPIPVKIINSPPTAASGVLKPKPETPTVMHQLAATNQLSGHTAGHSPEPLFSTKTIELANESLTIPGVAPVKRMCIGPTNTPTPLAAANQLNGLTAGHTPLPLYPTKTTELTTAKRVQAAQHAVFTISGDNQHNLPPAFCIPKSLSSIQQSMAPPPLLENNVQLPPTAIKTENLDEGYPTPPNKNDSPSDVSSNASTVSVGSTYKTQILKKINQIRLDGSTVVLRPTEGFVPLSTNSHHEFHNAFLNANKDIFEPKKRKCSPPGPEPTKETAIKNLYTQKPPQNAPNLTEEQRQQQPPQQQQQQPQPRVRKYWGPVDEFQITSVSDKINSNPKPASQPEQLAVQPADIIPAIKVKEECVDNQPSMFYPDSFELSNSSLDADVSLMINTMMTNQEPIDETESFKFINPSFPISYAKKQTAKDTSEKENEEVAASKEPEDTQPEEGKPQPDADKAPCEQPAEEAPAKVHTKNLRVKLKRSDRLKKLATRLRVRRPFQPSKSIPTRKSLRSLMSQNATK